MRCKQDGKSLAFETGTGSALLTSSLQWLTFSPVVSDAAFFFKTSESTINWLSTAFLFSFVSMTPVAIYVLHFGPRPSMILSAVLLFLGNWIRYAGTRSGVAKDGLTGGHFGVVMFGQILTGLAQPLVLAAPARFSDLWFTNQGRVAATALTSLANPFGAALGQLIVPFWVNSSKDIPNMVLYVSIIVSHSSIVKCGLTHCPNHTSSLPFAVCRRFLSMINRRRPWHRRPKRPRWHSLRRYATFPAQSSSGLCLFPLQYTSALSIRSRRY